MLLIALVLLVLYFLTGSLQSPIQNAARGELRQRRGLRDPAALRAGRPVRRGLHRDPRLRRVLQLRPRDLQSHSDPATGRLERGVRTAAAAPAVHLAPVPAVRPDAPA